MKKFKVSEGSRGTVVIGLVFMAFCELFWIHMTISSMQQGESFWQTIFFHLLTVIFVMLSIYLLYYDFPTGAWLSLDKEKANMHYRGRDHFHRWEDLQRWGFEEVDFGSPANEIIRPWVWFSFTDFYPRNRKPFLWEIRPYLSEVICFEYTEELMEEVMPHLPEECRQYIRGYLDENGKYLRRPEILSGTPEAQTEEAPKPEPLPPKSAPAPAAPAAKPVKFPISRNGIVFPWMGLIFFLGLEVYYLFFAGLFNAIQTNGIREFFVIPNLLVWAGILYCLWWCFFDFYNGFVAMDETGIRIRMGGEEPPVHRWENIQDYGIVDVRFALSGRTMFWVYASETPLTPEEKQNFKKLRHKLDRLAYFECTPASFGELMKHIPPEWQQELRRQVR